jgi:hypothetical protein
MTQGIKFLELRLGIKSMRMTKLLPVMRGLVSADVGGVGGPGIAVSLPDLPLA